MDTLVGPDHIAKALKPTSEYDVIYDPLFPPSP